MVKVRVYPWIVISLSCFIMLTLAIISPATGQSLPPTPTPQPRISPLAQEVASRTGLELSLVNEMLEAGIPAEEIDTEMAQEWQAHLDLLAQREQRRLQILVTSKSDVPSLEAVPSKPSIDVPTAEELLWQQIELAHAQGDIQTQLSLAEQLPASPARQRLLDSLSGKPTSPSIPQAGEFIGINGGVCAYNNWASALAAAVDGDTLYVEQGTWIGRIGEIDHDLTIIAAQNTCQDPATGGVTIDGDDTSTSFGGLADIGAGEQITFTNLILTNGTATYGGIIYSLSSDLVLDNTDLTYGQASSLGGCIRLIGGTATLINDSEITDCSTTGTGDGGGAALDNSELFLYNSSRIGDFGHGNTSADNGGGLYLVGSSVYMYNTSRIRSNTSTDYGGGVYANALSAIYMHDSADIGWSLSTAANNAEYGGGVYLYSTGDILSMEDDSAIQYNTASVYGGGVYMGIGSQLIMNSASILNNDAVSRGGGIYSLSTVYIDLNDGSLISENQATGASSYGGGLYLAGADAYITITNSSFLTNTSFLDYGGIRVMGVSTITLEADSTVAYNEALGGSGGGIGIYGAKMAIDNSRVEYNTAAVNGGGIYISDESTLNLIDSRIENNEADQDGGGIYNIGGEIYITCPTETGTVGHNDANNGNGGGIFDSSGNTLSIQSLSSGTCYVNSNEAGEDGAGLYMTDNTILEATGSVIFTYNIAHSDGGALFMDSGSQALFDDTDANTHRASFYNNWASTGNGGAIHATGNSRLVLLGVRLGVANHNVADTGSGGAIYLENSTADLYNSIIVNNTAQDNGAGIAAYTSTLTVGSVYSTLLTTRSSAPDAPQVIPCIPDDLPTNGYCSEIKNNVAEGDGGGLYLYNSSTIVANTAILTNTADIGSAIEVYLGEMELKNSLISANDALNSLKPATVYVNAGALPLDTAVLTATHNTIADNLGAGILYAANTEGEFNNNIVWGNDSRGTLDIFVETSCNDTQDSSVSGTGNIMSDPQFVTTQRGAYRLGFNSPVVNRCAENGLTNDLDGTMRPWGNGYDMGAFEAIIPMTFLPLVIH